MTETVSGVFETAFVVLFGVCETVSSAWSEPQADNRLTASDESEFYAFIFKVAILNSNIHWSVKDRVSNFVQCH